MSLLRHSIAGLAIALLAVVILWAVWLTGLAENRLASSSASALDCTMPDGWSGYSSQAVDDVTDEIQAAGYTLEEILAANCLPPDGNIPVDGAIYLPPDVIARLDPSCGPPQGWGYYATEAGDRLSSLADEFEVDLEDLLRANCFVDPSDFEPGLRIYAPIGSQEP